MIVYFANRGLDIIGMASTDLPKGFTIRADKKVEDIDSGVASFEFKITYTDEQREQAAQMCQAGNYLLRRHNRSDECYTIIDKKHNNKEQSYTIYAEDAGLDLLNEVCDAYKATSAQTIAWYINRFTSGSGWQIGINEIPNLTRTLEWTSSQNTSERVRSVATQFNNAEIGYSFDIEGLTIKAKYINIYKQRGKSVGTTLRLGTDINNIIETESIGNLVTELIPTGGTPQGTDTPINLRDVSYDDGDIYLYNGRLRIRSAQELWSRKLAEGGGGESYLTALYSYDTTNKNTLLNHAITELKKMSQPEVTYEIDLVTLPADTAIGDTVNVVDQEDRLYLTARLLKIEESVAQPKIKGTFGDFIVRDAGISAQVRELATQVSQIIRNRQYYTWFAYADDAQGTGISLDPTGKTYMGIAELQQSPTVDISDPSIFTWVELGQGGGGGNDSITLTVTSSDGAVFINTLINTTLTAHVYKNGIELTAVQIAGVGTLKWYDVATDTLLGTGVTYGITNGQSANVICRLED